MDEPSEHEALLQEARQNLQKGQIDRAMKLFHDVLEADAESVEAHEGLAAACFHLESYDDAIHHFERIAALQPLSGKPCVNLGAVYNRLKKYDDAVRVLRQAVQKDARSSEAFYNLGIAYRNLDQLSMAVTAYREALRLNEEMPEAHLNVANVYAEMGNNRNAITHYREALRLKPEMRRAEVGLKRAEEAIEKAKAEFSPFGRLVDTAEYTVRGDVATGAGRSLSSVEREKDRERIGALAEEVQASAEEVTEHLQFELTPAVMDLHRAVAEGADVASNIVEHQDTFVSAVGHSQVLRKRFRDALAAVRQHEQEMSLGETAEE